MTSKKVFWFALAAGSAALVLLFGRAAFRVSQGQAQSGSQLPPFAHVVFVPLEDHSYSQTVATQSDGVTPVCPAPANAPMPNLQALICSQGLATKYYADTHPAIGDYFTLASGQILTNNDNYTPGSSMSCSDSSPVACSNGGLGYQTVDNIAKEMEAAYGAGGWKGYGESIPYPGYHPSTSIPHCPSGGPDPTDSYYTYHHQPAF